MAFNYGTKVRISNKLLKALPQPVADHIRALQDDYGTIKSVRIVVEPAGYTQYLDEGCRYWTAVFNRHAGPQGAYEVLGGIQMASNDTVGGAGLRHEIGARIPIPVGAFVFEVYYAGIDGYQLRLVQVGEPALPEPARAAA